MQINQIRLIPVEITDQTGAATLNLTEQGIPASLAMLMPVAERTDALAHVVRPAPGLARVEVKTQGLHLAPLPWNGTSQPITIKLMAVWLADDGGKQTVAKTWSLPAGLSHVIEHNMSTRQFVETIKDGNGDPMFAGVTVLDDQSIRIDLTEAVPVEVAIIFFK